MLCPRNKVILAFPGMGKTPLSDKNAKYFDLDFGTFRSALGYTSDQNSEVLPLFVKYLQLLDEDHNGVVFMINEPLILTQVHVSHMYLPGWPLFSAKKMGVSEEQINRWSVDWRNYARKYHVPVTYVDKGLDFYLK